MRFQLQLLAYFHIKKELKFLPEASVLIGLEADSQGGAVHSQHTQDVDPVLD